MDGDEFSDDIFDRDFDEAPNSSKVVLRPYQVAAHEAVFKSWQDHRSVLLVLPTGCGKTLTAAAILRDRAKEGRILWLAHRGELLDQAAEALGKKIGLSCEIEKAERRADRRTLFGTSDVVVGSVQTLRGTRLTSWKDDSFATIVVDEAHHAPARTYRQILEQFPDAKVLGLTATPDRGDGIAMGHVFTDCAFTYETRTAITEGWLTPIVQKQVRVAEIDLSQVKTVRGDLDETELAKIMELEGSLHGIASAIAQSREGRPTIVFCTSVEQSKELSRIMNDYGIRSTQVDGTTPPLIRAERLTQFQTREVDALVNVGVLTEGFDAPLTACVAMARPTKSRSLYAQCLDAQTQILTDAGWRSIDDSLDDLRVAAFEPSSKTWHWSPILSRTERQLGDESMFGIESPHLSIRVTAGHRMLVRSRHGSEMRFERADSIGGELRLPVAAAHERPDANIADCDLMFLGYLLTDGNFNRLNNAITLYQSDKYPDVVARIGACIVACGFKFGHESSFPQSNFKRNHAMNRWWISKGAPRGRDKHLSGWGRLAEWVSDGKSLTPAFETLSARQVGVLLSAMIDGNGSKHVPDDHTRHSFTISLANRALGDAVQSMLARSGYRCNVVPMGDVACQIHGSNDREWSMLTKAADGRPIWRKVEAGQLERVWCVESDTGAIFIRRNGKVAIVGNCLGRGLRPVDPPEVDASAEFRRAAIAASRKPDCLILDFVGNSGKHKLINPIDILAGKPLPPEVEARVRELTEEGRPTEEALKQAEDEAIQREREREEKRKKNAAIRAKVAMKTRSVDPFGATTDALDPEHRATQAQLDYLANFVKPKDLEKLAPNLSKNAAWKLTDTLKKRRKEGLCTYGQARVLARAGLRIDVPVETASKIIDHLAANNWLPSAQILERFGEKKQDEGER